MAAADPDAANAGGAEDTANPDAAADADPGAEGDAGDANDVRTMTPPTTRRRSMAPPAATATRVPLTSPPCRTRR